MEVSLKEFRKDICIEVYLDGNWGLPFAEWTFEYLVYSYILSLVVVLAIIGIPMALGGTWWIRQKSRGGPS